jgi:lysophospholipase L1-like esterase
MKVRLALSVSLLVNACALSLVGYKVYNNWFEASVLKAPFRTSFFDTAPVEKGKIYFVGDSHTEAFELNELLYNQDVRNRGIWGDVSANVLKRMDNIIKAKPRKIFLMIGVNDICSGVPTASIASNVEQIIKTSKASIPGVTIYLESVLPTNQNILHSNESTINKIQELNSAYTKLSLKYNVNYIDLFPIFLGSEGLKDEYSFDGLHLNGQGYLVLAQILKPYVDNDHPTQLAVITKHLPEANKKLN